MTQPSPADELRAAAEAFRGPDGTITVTIPVAAADEIAQWLESWARPGIDTNAPWPDLHRALAVARAITGSQP